MKHVQYSAEHALFLKRAKRQKRKIVFLRLTVLIVLLGLWELLTATGVWDPFITGSPSRILQTTVQLLKEGTLWRHIGITLAETLIGFTIAVGIGYGVALLLWANDTLRRVMEPYIVVLNALPKIALGPLIIIWMGTGYTAIVFMTVLVSVIVCIMDLLAGFCSVDSAMLTLMRSLCADKRTILVKLIVPASLPTLMNTLKVAVGLSWIGSVMGEYIVSRAGLGYLIVYGGQVFRLDLVMTATLILCVLAGGMYAVIALLEKKLTKRP